MCVRACMRVCVRVRMRHELVPRRMMASYYASKAETIDQMLKTEAYFLQ